MTEQEQIFAYKELRNNGQAFFVNTYEDADRIIEALEKQIQIKPIALDKDREYCKCPICGEYVIDYCGNRMKYCRECGQKLDWGNEE